MFPLRLPDVSSLSAPAAGLARRAFNIALGILVGVLGAAVLASNLVQLTVTVPASGVLEPVRTWPVRSRASGMVSDILVRQGEAVQAGQLVARIDSLETAQAASQLETEYERQRLDRERAEQSGPLERRLRENQVAEADARLSRVRAVLRARLAEYGMVTDVESVLRSHRPGSHIAIDEAVAEVRSATADRASAVTQLEMLRLTELDQARQRLLENRLRSDARVARARLARLEVVAPATGIVLTERFDELIGSVVREGDVLVEIGDTSSWRVTLELPERGAVRIQLGDSALVEIPALSQLGNVTHLRGSVTFVSARQVAAGTSAARGGYRVHVALDSGQIGALGVQNIRTGLSTRARIVTRRQTMAGLFANYLKERLRA